MWLKMASGRLFVCIPRRKFMIRSVALILVAVAYSSASTQKVPASDPQALAYAAQSIAAMTGGTTVSDVTLNGSVSWTGGSSTETGTALLQASGTGESRMDLSLNSGTRTEIRDAQTGMTLGKWVAQDASSGKLAFHNCQIDSVWFFPTLGSLASGPNVVLSYVGQETRNGASVQHIRSYVYSALLLGSSDLNQLSTMDFFLDATTYLPLAITFNVHPDTDGSNNIPIEIDFSNYQPANGLTVPMHIQKYMQGTLTIDINLTNVTVNTGIPLSTFAIN
jgi:hypothetical protein